MPTSTWRWALAATSMISLLASCGGSETPATAAPGLEVPSSPTPSADPVATPDTTSPQDILDASLAAMEAATSYRFTIAADVDATVGGAATQIPITFSGVYQAPDRIQATLLIRVGQSAVGVEVKTIAGATYVGDSRTGQWQESQQLRSVLPDPARLPTDLAQDLRAVEVTKDSVSGAPAHRLQGLTPLGMFGELRPNGPVSLWIGAEDFLVRRIEAEGQIRLQELGFLLGNYGISNASGATVSMRLSAFDEPVAIDLPGRSVEPAPTGPGQRFPDQGNDHVRRGDLHPTYNSAPATSGWHYGQPLAPAPLGSPRGGLARRGLATQPGARRDRRALRLSSRLR